MTAVSLLNPYAPQPAANFSSDGNLATVQTTPPTTTAKNSGDAGQPSDQSGQGAGNGTGTGGAQLAALLKKGHGEMPMQKPTPESVVKAQSESDPATEFLARQADLKTKAQAAEATRTAERLAQKEVEIKEKAAQAAQPEYVMPNPLPTAPILQEKEP
ncbi:MAG: hypothetical protein WBV71_14955 [Roseobacter sp.]